MRVLTKVGHDQYIEVDTDLERPVTVKMTRDEAYRFRLKFQVDDQAHYAVEKADRDYEEANREIK